MTMTILHQVMQGKSGCKTIVEYHTADSKSIKIAPQDQSRTDLPIAK